LAQRLKRCCGRW